MNKMPLAKRVLTALGLSLLVFTITSCHWWHRPHVPRPPHLPAVPAPPIP